MLIIQPSLPSYREDFFCQLASKFSKNITILHFGEKSGIKHEYVTEVIGEVFEFKGLRFVKNLKAIMRNHTVIVVGFDPHWLNLFLLPLLVRDKRVVLWGHGLGKNWCVNHLRVLVAKKADSFVTYSEENRQRMICAGASVDKVFVANNTLYVNNARDTSSLSRKNFIFVGRLQRRKKLDVFFRIFAELGLGGHGYTVTVVGDGEEEKVYLWDCAVKLGVLNFVRFVKGTTSNSDLLKYFSDAICYVSPGAVGLGVLHSFAYGVPVLTMQDVNHGPEVSNIKNGVNGYIFNGKEEFLVKLDRLLESGRFIEMGQAAFHYFENKRSMSQMVESFLIAAADK